MATSTPDNIWSPDGTSKYNLTTDLAAMASSVQAALISRANMRKGTAAQRTAYAAKATEGDAWADSDGSKLIYQFVGGRWVPLNRKSITFTRQDIGGAITNIALPAAPNPAEADLVVRYGYISGNTAISAGIGYLPVDGVRFTPAFSNVLHVSITPVHNGGYVATAPMPALDTLNAGGFRVMYPGMSASAPRAVLWMAVGYA